MRKLVTVFAMTVLVMGVASAAVAAEDGKALYDSKCAMCHGKDGVAKAMAKGSKNFNDPAFQKEMSAESIEKVTTDGKNKMPAQKGKLSAEQIKAIADYIKTLAPAK